MPDAVATPASAPSRSATASSSMDRLQCLAERSDLVDLDEDGVGHALVDALGEALHVGDEQVVAHELHAIPEPIGQELPSPPVVFGHAVLDADDGIALDPSVVKVD